jgi:cysteinyl-tRNA synthetase
MVFSIPNSASSGFQSYGPHIDAKLDQWVEFKRAKNFAAADRLREELRALGVASPNVARPDPKRAGSSAFTENQSFGPEIDAKLDRWVQLKRAKNFAAADALKAELQAEGVDDPNSARPKNAVQSFGPEIDAKLEQWVQHKRDKDFAAADALKMELKEAGVDDPEAARPKAGAGGAGPQSFSPVINAKLDLWVQHKRAKNYAAADAIAEELRAAGINDPNSARPDPKRGGQGGGNGGFGAQTQSMQDMMSSMMGSMLQNMMQGNMGNGGNMMQNNMMQAMLSNMGTGGAMRAGNSHRARPY